RGRRSSRSGPANLPENPARSAPGPCGPGSALLARGPARRRGSRPGGRPRCRGTARGRGRPPPTWEFRRPSPERRGRGLGFPARLGRDPRSVPERSLRPGVGPAAGASGRRRLGLLLLLVVVVGGTLGEALLELLRGLPHRPGQLRQLG